MDIDLELDYSDHISNFLRSKLEQAKSENSDLEASLQHRKKVLSDLHEELAKINSTSATLGEFWKRIINGNYVIGVEIKNENSSVLSNISVILDTTSPSSLIYKTHVISSTDPLKPISHLSDSGQIIIVFPIPRFTDCLSHTLSGSVTFLKDNKKIFIEFPSTIKLTPQDVTNSSVIVDVCKLIGGSIPDLLASMLSCQKHDFVVVKPENLTFHLEVDCLLTKINFQSKRKLYWIQKLTPILDGTLLEVEEELGEKPQLNFYCKNEDLAMALLHYLHRTIREAVILPKSLYRPDLSMVELTEQLRSVFTKIRNLKESSLDSKDLISKLVDLTHESDVLVARIKEKKSS